MWYLQILIEICVSIQLYIYTFIRFFPRIDTDTTDTYRYEVSILSDVSPITKWKQKSIASRKLRVRMQNNRLGTRPMGRAEGGRDLWLFDIPFRKNAAYQRLRFESIRPTGRAPRRLLHAHPELRFAGSNFGIIEAQK